MIFLLKVIFFTSISLLFQLIFTEGAWAWGPGVHTVIACRISDEIGQILPVIARVIQSYPLEYLYGSLAADFFVGKGRKNRDGHSHNWKTGFRFLNGSRDDREAAYAYGFFSHLAADVVAHNYFVPNLIRKTSTWKRMGHLYCEAKADNFAGPLYTRIAREVLSKEELGCDDLLKAAVGKRRRGLKARRHLFTQSVKLTDFLNGSQSMSPVKRESRYKVSPEYLIFMINLSYRLVRDFLTYPDTSLCLTYDPIGSQNLRLASRNGFLSKLFNMPSPIYQFAVDQELLEI